MARRNRKRITGWITLLVLAVFVLIGSYVYATYFNVLLPDTTTQPVATPSIIKSLPTSAVLSGQWVEQANSGTVETTNQQAIAPNQAVAPMPPTQLLVEDTGLGNRVYIAWRAPVGQLYDGVIIQRDIEPTFSNPVIVGEQLPATGELFDTDVENLQTYYYRLQSFRSNPAQTSVFTEVVTVIPRDVMPPAPVSITAITSVDLVNLPSDAKAGVDIEWAPSTGEVAEYRLYRSVVEGSLGTVVESTDAATTSARDTSVEPGVTYYYAVIAVDSAQNESATSVTVPAAGNLVPFKTVSSANNPNGN